MRKAGPHVESFDLEVNENVNLEREDCRKLTSIMNAVQSLVVCTYDEVLDRYVALLQSRSDASEEGRSISFRYVAEDDYVRNRLRHAGQVSRMLNSAGSGRRPLILYGHLGEPCRSI